IASRIQVTVKPRKIAARDLQADAVTRRKIVTRGVQVDGQRIRAAWLHPDLPIETLAVTPAEDPVLQIEGGSIGIHIHELGGEVGIARARSDEQFQFDWSCDLGTLCQRWSGVDQDIWPALEGRLILSAGGHCGNGILWVVLKLVCRLIGGVL